MVHWGETEIRDQLGRIVAPVGVGDANGLKDEQTSFARSIIPQPERKFQAGRQTLQNLFDSKIKPTLLLCPMAKTAMDLWKEIAKDEKSVDKSRNRPKEFQIVNNWQGIGSFAKLDQNLCQMCHEKTKPNQKRSRSL